MSQPPAAAAPDTGARRPGPEPGQAGSPPAYTDIPDGTGKCRDCGRVLTLTWTGNGALIVHGPRAARCPGSGRPPVPWLQASGLPAWTDLTDLDKGAAVLQARYPGWPQLQPPYFDHPVLLSLGTDAAHRYAVRVAVAGRSTPAPELTRLLNLAAAAHRARRLQPGHGDAGRNPQAAIGLSFPGAPVTAGTRPASRPAPAAPVPPDRRTSPASRRGISRESEPPAGRRR
jgi:hypothetical protein